MASTASADEARPSALVLVLDASGSMNEPDGHGSTKIAAAKSAMTTIVGQLPADVQVGLRVYGHRVPSKPDHAKACQDTQLVAPVAPLDKAGLTSAISQFKAKGETPIGLSLQQAAADLPKGSAGSIVLVSDGQDSCAPPVPCDVARQLKASGVQLTVDTVGLKVDAKARSELTCIAQATGGSYTDVTDTAQLANKLGTVTQKAARPRRAIGGGTKVEGATTAGDAPVISAGTYTDSIVNDETLYYAVDLAEGQKATAHVTMNAAVSTSNVDQVWLWWSSDHEDVINKTFKVGQRESLAVSTSVGPVVTASSTGGAGSSGEARRAGRYYLALNSKPIGSSGLTELPLAIDVAITGADGKQAAASGDAASSPTVDGQAAVSPPSGQAGPAGREQGGFLSSPLAHRAEGAAAGLVVGLLLGALVMGLRRRGGGRGQVPPGGP